MSAEDIIKRLKQLEEEKTELLKILQKIDNFSNKEDKKEFKLMFDGGSRGNPGLCGAGYVIYENGKEVAKSGRIVSEQNTNNYAEYMGLLLGLHTAIKMDIKNLIIEGDSKLVINQLNGSYKCKSFNLMPLIEKTKEYLSKLSNYILKHIPRDENSVADGLANIAMNNYNKKKH